MDSLTQLALGAAVGEATLGRKVGYRAMLWGGICATVPDLDVLLQFDDAIARMTFHRSILHSLFVLAALSPLLAWLIVKMHPQTRPHYMGWLVLVFAAFATHVLLDSLTVFGTQILWPFGADPVTWGTIFIIDPLYTLPLLIGVIGAALARRRGLRPYVWNLLGLTISSAYLAWSIAAKVHVNDVARVALAQQGIAYERFITMPTPFNTLLWRVVAVDPKAYHVGYYSVLYNETAIRFESYPRQSDLLAELGAHTPVTSLRWFSKGFYTARSEGTDILMIDLRAGLEPYYEFLFKVGESVDGHIKAVRSERLPIHRDWTRLQWVWRTIFEPDVLAVDGVSQIGNVTTKLTPSDLVDPS